MQSWQLDAELDFQEHQWTAYDFVLDHPRCQLWLDMGLGKTVTVLTAIADLQARGEIGKVLVVAPLRVARKVWPDEVKKWAHLEHLRVSSIVGDQYDREAALEQDADIYTINYDNLQWLTDQFRKKGVSRMSQPWRWDWIVCDESSALKNRETNRWKALYRVFRHAKRFTNLTGSPAPNGLADTWAPMYFIDEGRSLGRSLGAFRDRWFSIKKYEYRYKPEPGAKDQIYKRIAPHTLSMRAEDYLDLPPIMHNPIMVDMDPMAREKYNHLVKKMWVKMDAKDITAANRGVCFGKCLQAANGAMYIDDKGEWEQFCSNKLEALKELLRASIDEGKPVLLFYSFQSDRERIEKVLKALRISKKRYRILKSIKDEEDWNAGKLDVLAMHPASGGHGLNLQDGGETIVWYGLNPSLELYEQGNARLAGGFRRVGKNIIIHHILTEDTVDERVFEILLEKGATQDELFAAVGAAQ